MLAVAFTLALVALIAFLIVVSVTRYNTRVVMDPTKIRGFKNDELTANALLIFKRGRLVNSNLSSVKSQVGVETRFELSEDLAKIFVISKYAGRFTSLTLQFEVRDILNLFSKQIYTVYADFTYDSHRLKLNLASPATSEESQPNILPLEERFRASQPPRRQSLSTIASNSGLFSHFE